MMEFPSGSTAEVVLAFHLHSKSEGTTEVNNLSLPALPHTVRELKQIVQREFSVPACVQTVTYQTEVLSDDVELASRRLRSGDSVDVTFLSRGDCRSVEEVNAWMRTLIEAFDQNQSRREIGDYNVDVVVFDGLQSSLDLALGYDLFQWLIPKTMVNKAYFESSGGLNLLFELYQRMLRREWSSLRLRQKYLESVCTQAFANFGETAALRRKLIKMGVLEMCFKSLLRVPILSDVPISDKSSSESDQEANNFFLKAEMDNALHLLCCFSELPECQLPIASRSNIMTQTVCMALSPSYPSVTKALASEVFLCLAHTPATHQFLAMDFVISGMLKALTDQSSKVENTPTGLMELVGLRCFTLVWMAILALQSPHSLSMKNTAHLHMIRDCMTQFLAETKIEDIRQYEIDRGTLWATLLPYVKQAYLPNTLTGLKRGPGLQVVSEIQTLGIKVILFFLHSLISTPLYHTLLIKEDLLDFVVSLPWHVPPSCRPEAVALTSELCTSMPNVGPPRLCNLAKAQLAKFCLGLEQVLKMSVSEIASHCYGFH